MNIWHLKKKSEKDEQKEILDKVLAKELADLIKESRAKFPSVREDIISKAFRWCVEAHANKVRKSGELYYKHPLAVAKIVIDEIHLDDISVVCALLHDVINYGEKYTLDDIRSEFGNTIAEIVDGVSKIQNIEEKQFGQLENYRKLLLSLFKDVRIILIKLADRLQNMRTLEYLELGKQKRISEETLEIFAPFAQRFGLGNIKWELEDLAFKHLNREAYDEIRNKLKLSRKEREKYIEDFIKPIKENLKNDELIKANNINFEIFGRAKHIYSIYNKSILRKKPVEELYDLFAIRIVLDSDDANYCYIAYSVTSKIYRLIPDTFKDYIANPKSNGYQSIHSAFLGKDEKMVEVQIRTKTMHETADKGFAAHFKYKRGFLPAESVLDNNAYEMWLDAVRDIFENPADEKPEELLERVKKNLVMDEIHVFTPSNEFKTFPRDATPLDFAYAIHTDIGNHCLGAKVNGRIVPLNYKMNSGDIVEILTSKSETLKNEWIHYVVTHKAISSIQKYIKDKIKTQVADGRKKWEDLLKLGAIKPDEIDFENLINLLNLKDENELYLALNSDSLDNSYLYEILFKSISSPADKKDSKLKRIKEKLIVAKGPQKKDLNLPIKFANCCYPVRGDNVISLIYPGKEFVVHRTDCKKAQKILKNKEQSVFEFDWTMSELNSFLTKLLIQGDQDAALINDLTTSILSNTGVTIKGFKFDTADMEFTGSISLVLENSVQLNIIIQKLKSIRGIRKVERVFE